MTALPPLLDLENYPGDDILSRWPFFIEDVYRRYLNTVALGKLTFQGLKVNCQFRPESHGKHYAFWHMMQEGSGGRNEEDRTPDLDRCRRVEWIAWTILNAGVDESVRVFKQALRGNEVSWVMWLHESSYALILWERKDYFLLKTAFVVKSHKKKEFEKDWKLHQALNG